MPIKNQPQILCHLVFAVLSGGPAGPEGGGWFLILAGKQVYHWSCPMRGWGTKEKWFILKSQCCYRLSCCCFCSCSYAKTEKQKNGKTEKRKNRKMEKRKNVRFRVFFLLFGKEPGRDQLHFHLAWSQGWGRNEGHLLAPHPSPPS